MPADTADDVAALVGQLSEERPRRDLVRDGADRRSFDDSGIWIPPAGPAERRFTPHRLAVELRPTAPELSTVDHPVGSPIAQVVRDERSTNVAWHYVSLRLTGLPGFPEWPPGRVHRRRCTGAKTRRTETLAAAGPESRAVIADR
jgi:hypothetical protein